jgi:hypothetical protein
MKAQVLAEKLLTLVPRQGTRGNLTHRRVPPPQWRIDFGPCSNLRSLEPTGCWLSKSFVRIYKASPLITQLGGRVLVNSTKDG